MIGCFRIAQAYRRWWYSSILPLPQYRLHNKPPDPFWWFACICRIRPMRSVSSFIELYTVEPAVSVPEYTRKKHSLPTYGSVAILKASAAKGSSSEECVFLLPHSVSGLMPLILLDISRRRAYNQRLHPAASERPCSCKTVPQHNRNHRVMRWWIYGWQLSISSKVNSSPVEVFFHQAHRQSLRYARA